MEERSERVDHAIAVIDRLAGAKTAVDALGNDKLAQLIEVARREADLPGEEVKRALGQQ